MVYTVNDALRSITLYDQTNAMKYQMIKQKLNPNHLVMMDDLNHRECELICDAPHVLIKIDHNIYSAEFQYIPQQQRFNTVSLIRPPLVEHIVVNLPQGTLRIEQSSKRDFLIQINDTTIGKCNDIMAHHKHFRINEEYNPTMVCIIVGLCLFMLHDDDIEIV